MEVKFCKHCQTDHPLMGEFWYFRAGSPKACKVYKKYYEDTHKDKNAETRQAYLLENKEKIRKQKQDWLAKNKESSYRKHAEYTKARYSMDTDFKIRKRVRTRLRQALGKNQKAGSAVSDLGCTIPELKQYLESLFQEGMTWNNWGLLGWHIDHIVPLSSFDLTDREQLLKACHYTNLQPLWAEENLKKGDKNVFTYQS